MTVTIIVATTALGLFVVKAKASEWGYAVASAYSAASSSDRQGCAHAPPLRDSALSVATFLVGCGQRLRICYGSRCVIATRWDSGPFVAGRQIDVNVGVARALGFSSTASWGVRAVRWTPPTLPTSRGATAYLPWLRGLLEARNLPGTQPVTSRVSGRVGEAPFRAAHGADAPRAEPRPAPA